MPPLDTLGDINAHVDCTLIYPCSSKISLGRKFVLALCGRFVHTTSSATIEAPLDSARIVVSWPSEGVFVCETTLHPSRTSMPSSSSLSAAFCLNGIGSGSAASNVGRDCIKVTFILGNIVFISAANSTPTAPATILVLRRHTLLL